jgi:hypothetical protein
MIPVHIHILKQRAAGIMATRLVTTTVTFWQEILPCATEEAQVPSTVNAKTGW